MDSRTKLLIGILGGVSACCIGSTAFMNNASYQTQEVLEAKSLHDSIQLSREINGNLGQSLDMVDRLVSVLTIQNLILLAVVVAVFVGAIGAARRIGGSRHAPAQETIATGPHYVSFSERGVDHLLSLPEPQREVAAREVAAILAALNHSLGKGEVIEPDNQSKGIVKSGRWS